MSGTTTILVGVIAFSILLIAWLNYVNLATARALDRGREVGVRKVSGASGGQLIRQFLTESLLVNGLAIALQERAMVRAFRLAA